MKHFEMPLDAVREKEFAPSEEHLRIARAERNRGESRKILDRLSRFGRKYAFPIFGTAAIHGGALHAISDSDESVEPLRSATQSIGMSGAHAEYAPADKADQKAKEQAKVQELIVELQDRSAEDIHNLIVRELNEERGGGPWMSLESYWLLTRTTIEQDLARTYGKDSRSTEEILQLVDEDTDMKMRNLQQRWDGQIARVINDSAYQWTGNIEQDVLTMNSALFLGDDAMFAGYQRDADTFRQQIDSGNADCQGARWIPLMLEEVYQKKVTAHEMDQSALDDLHTDLRALHWDGQQKPRRSGHVVVYNTAFNEFYDLGDKQWTLGNQSPYTHNVGREHTARDQALAELTQNYAPYLPLYDRHYVRNIAEDERRHTTPTGIYLDKEIPERVMSFGEASEGEEKMQREHREIHNEDRKAFLEIIDDPNVAAYLVETDEWGSDETRKQFREWYYAYAFEGRGHPEKIKTVRKRLLLLNVHNAGRVAAIPPKDFYREYVLDRDHKNDHSTFRSLQDISLKKTTVEAVVKAFQKQIVENDAKHNEQMMAWEFLDDAEEYFLFHEYREEILIDIARVRAVLETDLYKPWSLHWKTPEEISVFSREEIDYFLEQNWGPSDFDNNDQKREAFINAVLREIPIVSERETDMLSLSDGMRLSYLIDIPVNAHSEEFSRRLDEWFGKNPNLRKRYFREDPQRFLSIGWDLHQMVYLKKAYPALYTHEPVKTAEEEIRGAIRSGSGEYYTSYGDDGMRDHYPIFSENITNKDVVFPAEKEKIVNMFTNFYDRSTGQYVPQSNTHNRFYDLYIIGENERLDSKVFFAAYADFSTSKSLEWYRVDDVFRINDVPFTETPRWHDTVGYYTDRYMKDYGPPRIREGKE